MSVPQAFLGGPGGIYRVATGHDDSTDRVGFRVQTRAVAPAGAALDSIFDRIFLSITSSVAATITVTPVVDGQDMATAAFTFSLRKNTASTDPRSRVIENVLRTARSGLCLALRGTWISFKIEADSVEGPGLLVLDRIAVEWDPARAGSKERP